MPTLPPVTQKFVLHWGEMGARWGVNRTMGQIHALLYLSPRPLPAEEIAETLGVARSNVSTSLRELQGWGVVRVVHHLGDRRDHFESMRDVWEMFRVILAERKRREVDPTIAMLQSCLKDLETGPQDAAMRQKVEDMLEFLEAMTSAYEEFTRLPTGALREMTRIKGKLRKLLGGKRK